MIRCIGASDVRLRRHQALREYEIKKWHPENRESLGGLLVRVKAILQNRSGIQYRRGSRAFFPPRTSLGRVERQRYKKAESAAKRGRVRAEVRTNPPISVMFANVCDGNPRPRFNSSTTQRLRLPS